jgi:sugar phosphate isomerase/epimerase
MQRSIDLAHTLGAHTVIVHAGSVDLDRVLDDKLCALFDSGGEHSVEFIETRLQLEKRRKELAPPRLQAVKKSLVELLEYAAVKGIRLGLENRFHYLEIPSPDELGILLEMAGPEHLGFLYDVGHAQALSQLGFFPHKQWLERFASRMIGIHLHDAAGIKDHQNPGQGEVDFNRISACIPKSAYLALEIQGFYTQEQVKAGLMYLQEHGFIL